MQARRVLASSPQPSHEVLFKCSNVQDVCSNVSTCGCTCYVAFLSFAMLCVSTMVANVMLHMRDASAYFHLIAARAGLDATPRVHAALALSHKGGGIHKKTVAGR